jgi:SAM-dependent methyltransferase
MSLLTTDHRRPHPGAGPQPSHPSFVAPVVLRADTGEALDLDLRRWHDPATDEEAALLATVDGPVIDLGCGPGRLVVSLASRRVPALGVDSSPSAVALARRRGATVLERDLFGPLPGEGRWATALLFDGNVGIGGDPVGLLRRLRDLLTQDGRVVVELDPPGSGSAVVRVRVAHGLRRSDWFPWCHLAANHASVVAEAASLRVAEQWQDTGRWFAVLAPEGLPR